MNQPGACREQGDVIWNAANLLRGPYRPPQYRRVMIPKAWSGGATQDRYEDHPLGGGDYVLQVKGNQPFVESLVRREQCEHANTFVQGLLSNLGHKNVESIAYHFGQQRMPLPWFVGTWLW